MTAEEPAVPNQAVAEGKPDVFRSPMAVLVWWLWLLFALGNLIDLAVQGRDRTSVDAAVALLLITGIVYATAQRPRVISADGGVTIKNPIRDHKLSWSVIDNFDVLDLIRAHCSWQDGAAERHKVYYAWAVHASRRRQVNAQVRAARRATRPGQSRGAAQSRGLGFSVPAPPPRSAGYAAPAPQSLAGEADQVVRTLSERLEAAHDTAGASAPVSAWSWSAIAAMVVPAIALLIVLLA